MGDTPSLKSEAAAELKAKLGRLPPGLARHITERVMKALPLDIALDPCVAICAALVDDGQTCTGRGHLDGTCPPLVA